MKNLMKPFFPSIAVILGAILFLLIGGFVVSFIKIDIISYILELAVIGTSIIALSKIYEDAQISVNAKIGLCFIFIIFVILYWILIYPKFKELSLFCPGCNLFELITYIVK